MSQERVHNLRRWVQSLAWVLPALLLLVMGVVLYLVSRHEAQRSVDLELSSWAEQLRVEAYGAEGWKVTAFARALHDAPHWCILSSEGALLDVDGFLPGLIGPVRPIPAAAYNQPTTVTSEFGVAYRLFARKVTGGSVVVGISEPDDVGSADRVLLDNAEKFGDSLEQSRRLPLRQLNESIEVAVVSDSGEIQSAYGGIPLLTSPTPIPKRVSYRDLDLPPHFYRVAQVAVRSSTGEPVGVVSVYKETTLVRALVSQQLTIFALIAAAFFVVALLMVLRREQSYRRENVTTAEALQRGEGEEVEFKAGFQWDIIRKVKNPLLPKATVVAVAGFGNKRGGKLIIGVDDNGSVVGLDGDLSIVDGSREKFLRTVGQTLSAHLGESSSAYWSIGLETIGERLVCVIDVRRSREPLYVRAGNVEEFMVRVGASTRPYNIREAHRYIIEHWGSIPLRWLAAVGGHYTPAPGWQQGADAAA